MEASGVVCEKPKCDTMLVDKLPEEFNEMKIKDEKVEKEMEATVVDGNRTETGHIIVRLSVVKMARPSRFLELCHTYMGYESATGTSNLKTF